MSEVKPPVLSDKQIADVLGYFDDFASIRNVAEAQRDADYKHEQATIREIFEVYDAYIKALEEEIDSLGGLAYIHGWRSDKAKLGKECRARIQSLKDRYKEKQSKQ